MERWVGQASALLSILLAFAVALYLIYRWVSTHPERLRRVAERLKGRRLQAFLRTPAGLWLRRRFSSREAYGLTLTIGIILIGLFSWAFGGLAQDLLAQDPLVRADVAVLRFVHSRSEPYPTLAIWVFEALLSPEVLVPAGATVGFVLAILAYKRGVYRWGLYGAVLLTTVPGAEVLAEILKILFHRPRPPASLQLVPEGGYGFPSSHAAVAVALGAAIWYLFSLRSKESWGGSWRAKARVGSAVVAVALLVGLGRVYTGTAYPSDVLAGWALGGVWASVCLTAAEVFRRFHESGAPLPETGVQYARFSLVGASNALVDLGTINLLLLIAPTRDPAQLVAYNLVALLLTNANSYLWNTLWTFRGRSRHSLKQVGAFAAQAALSIGVGSLALWIVAYWLGSYPGLSPLVVGNTAKLVSMFVGSTTSFILLRFFVFRGKEHR